jgi:transposase-like protein
MEFPITDLLDYDSSVNWIIQYFHAGELKCPRCQQPATHTRKFRRTQRSDLAVYRCRACGTAYNLYTGTVFQQSHLTPQQVVLLLRGFCKGETTRELAAEVGLSYKTVLTLRHAVHANAEAAQPNTPLLDHDTETDEMFQNAGEKRRTAHRSGRSPALPGQQSPRTRYL